MVGALDLGLHRLRLEVGVAVAGTLEEGIETTVTGWWWAFAKKHYFDPFTWQTDLRRIESIYHERGFYQAEVLADQVKPVDDGVDLEVRVREGKPTVIASLRFEGLAGLTRAQREQVTKELGLTGVFEQGRWEAAQQTIRARLRALGYAQARVAGRALVDVGTQKASLLIVTQPGPVCTFGKIVITSGPSPRIRPLWIREQVRVAIADGQRFSEDALAEAQRRVFAMGVFSVVKVAAGDPDPATNRMPVLVEVREAPLHMLQAGVGVKIDQVRNEARAIAEWSHLDFLGGMRKLTLRGEGGWAFIPSIYAVARNDVAAGARSGPIARLRHALEQPRLFGAPLLRGRVELDLERTLEQAYDALGGKASVGASWRPWSDATTR